MAIIVNRSRPDRTAECRQSLGEWIARMHGPTPGWADGPVHLVMALGSESDDAFIGRLTRQAYPPASLAPRIRMFAVPQTVAGLMARDSDKRMRYKDLGPAAAFIDLDGWVEEMCVRERIRTAPAEITRRIRELTRVGYHRRAASDQLPGFD